MQILFLAIHLLLAKPDVHNVQVAFFRLYESDEILQLDVDIELKDIISELNVEEEEISEKVLKDYLKHNLQFQFDSKISELNIYKFQMEAKHLTIQARFDDTKPSFQSLNIKNTCLLSLEDHSNIIEIRVQDQERDFLMNKERTSIQVSL